MDKLTLSLLLLSGCASDMSGQSMPPDAGAVITHDAADESIASCAVIAALHGPNEVHIAMATDCRPAQDVQVDIEFQLPEESSSVPFQLWDVACPGGRVQAHAFEDSRIAEISGSIVTRDGTIICAVTVVNI